MLTAQGQSLPVCAAAWPACQLERPQLRADRSPWRVTDVTILHFVKFYKACNS